MEKKPTVTGTIISTVSAIFCLTIIYGSQPPVLPWQGQLLLTTAMLTLTGYDYATLIEQEKWPKKWLKCAVVLFNVSSWIMLIAAFIFAKQVLFAK